MPVIEDHLCGLAASQAYQRGAEAHRSNTEQILTDVRLTIVPGGEAISA
jgi:hypothetical protein